MFDLLRKKIQQFTQKIVGNAEENVPAAPPTSAPEAIAPTPPASPALIEEKKEDVSPSAPVVSEEICRFRRGQYMQ
jgi:hypothetical protein